MTEWNQILREEWYKQEKPDESVVNLVASLKKKKIKLRSLDVGCGAGRNLIYLANNGFEAYGIDFSETGLDFSKERLRKQNLEAAIIKGDMKTLPYRDSCFDLIMCLFTIYHQKLEKILGTISEIHRTLKKDGIILMNFQSKRSHMYGKGIEIEKDTFVRQDGPEKGVIHHFSEKEEIMKLLNDFKTIKIKTLERTLPDGYLQSRLVVTATR